MRLQQLQLRPHLVDQSIKMTRRFCAAAVRYATFVPPHDAAIAARPAEVILVLHTCASRGSPTRVSCGPLFAGTCARAASAVRVVVNTGSHTHTVAQATMDTAVMCIQSILDDLDNDNAIKVRLRAHVASGLLSLCTECRYGA